MRRNPRVADSSTSILVLLLGVPKQVRLVGVAIIAQHPAVELAAYRLSQGRDAGVQLRSVLRFERQFPPA